MAIFQNKDVKAIQNKAISFAPLDSGELRSGINVKRTGSKMVITYPALEYLPDLEDQTSRAKSTYRRTRFKGKSTFGFIENQTFNGVLRYLELRLVEFRNLKSSKRLSDNILQARRTAQSNRGKK